MAGLPNYSILNPMMSRLPDGERQALQSERLVTMVNYVYDNAPFWRAKFDAAGVTPGDIKGIEDLPKIPFCTKAELLADQEAHPPYGAYTCTEQRQWARLITTSGTTGQPLRRVFSQRDWDYILDRFQRAPHMGPGDISIILGPIDGLMGPTAAYESGIRMGAIMVLAGMYDSKSKIKLIQDLKPVTISSTASYLLRLLEVAEEMGVDARQLGLRGIASVGEPGAAIPATRKRLAEGWNANVIDGFGMTELFPLGGNCPGNTALHIAADMAITEIIDPETGEQLPSGEEGEVVFTNLVGDTQPLLRYRSRDISRITAGEPCPACGHTGPRLEGSIIGRVDDMIWFRGANIFPSAIEEAVRSFDELSHEYQIVVDGDGTLPRMTINLEACNGISGKVAADLQVRAAAAIKSAIRVNAEVSLVEAGSLPRDDDGNKIRRVIDNRTDSDRG
ncbi:MAG: AMP-binding protein [Rhodospirillales bacterium]|nr:AMP-binding protein [Rhodospirillales bacterium]|tara:strand:- start:627 stop:1970 length:1344 start_codon:yes stop_codon:yes gene_type:complete